MTDAFCVEGLHRVARSLRRVCQDGSDAAAREDMALASLLGGLALANAGLGAVHGLAAPIGGMYPAPHGAVCAALLPIAMETNLRALRSRQPDSEALRRYQDVARILTGLPSASADDGASWVRDLCRDLAIPTLTALGIHRTDFALLAAKAAEASSMKANPILLAPEEVLGILEQA
jgi:alcohol dehydrogenase class IV